MICPACGSCRTLMLRSLWMRNGTPSLPTRSWRKNTGPGLSSLMAMAIRASSGSSASSPSPEQTTSNSRLIMGAAVAVPMR
ncbi:Uncharacterised protein [Bordetella pertussis]|nr:Uncharacterised protein [Bordetella pertussis]